MAICGVEAVEILKKLSSEVELYRKDNTDKFWSYKMKRGTRREFAFDPTTKTKLIVRFDIAPPAIPGVVEIEKILGKDVSTSLDRVFTGGVHRAAYKATIESEARFHAVLKALT